MVTCCGLIIESAVREPIPVPLTGVSVQVNIIDLVAEVTIEQRYVNRESSPIEAVYKFPLDEGSFKNFCLGAQMCNMPFSQELQFVVSQLKLMAVS